MTALCPLQAGHIAPCDSQGQEGARGQVAQLLRGLLVRNTPSRNTPLPTEVLGAEPPLPRLRGELRAGVLPPPRCPRSPSLM